MEKKQLRRFLVFGTACVLGLYACTQEMDGQKPVKKFRALPNEMVVKRPVPTVFLHGYKGNRLSFGGMILRLTREKVATRSILLTVAADGSLSETGEWVGEENPLIQVVFEDNTNHEWQQAIWLQKVLTYLAETHHVKKVNLVGHSMGGVSIMRYLMTYGATGLPLEIQNVVTIGSPFNEFVAEPRSIKEVEELGPTAAAPRFVSYAQDFEHFPESTDYLNIAGDIAGDGEGDGTVPLGSVVALNYLFKEHHRSYRFELVTGKQAQHSSLHENRQVDQLLIDFLWK